MSKINILEIVTNKKYFYDTDTKSNYRNISEIKDNRLFFTNYGGGFVRSVSLENNDFVKAIEEKKITFTNDEPFDEYHIGKIYLECYEGGKPFDYVEGYISNNKFWNGWRIVNMTLEGIKKHNHLILQSNNFADLNNDPNSPIFKIIDDDTIELKDEEEEGGKIIIKSHELIHEGKKIKVFDPCSMGWCWSEITE